VNKVNSIKPLTFTESLRSADGAALADTHTAQENENIRECHSHSAISVDLPASFPSHFLPLPAVASCCDKVQSLRHRIISNGRWKDRFTHLIYHKRIFRMEGTISISESQGGTLDPVLRASTGCPSSRPSVAGTDDIRQLLQSPTLASLHRHCRCHAKNLIPSTVVSEANVIASQRHGM
jgi:hypothetical protein